VVSVLKKMCVELRASNIGNYTGRHERVTKFIYSLLSP